MSELPTIKSFPINVVLTVTTGRLLTKGEGPRDNGIGQLYDILNWMTGDNLFTHVLPRAAEFARPILYRLFPVLGVAEACLGKLDRWLAADKTEGKTEFLKMWLAELKMIQPELKDEYAIPSFKDEWESKNPLEEAVNMFGAEKISVAVIGQ